MEHLSYITASHQVCSCAIPEVSEVEAVVSVSVPSPVADTAMSSDAVLLLVESW